MTDPLKPPTDNRYNLMVVGGIVLGVSCVIFPVLLFLRTSMEYLTEYRASEELRVHEKFSTERSATLGIRKQQAAELKNKLQAQLKKLNPESRSPGNSGEVDKLDSRINEANSRIESIEDALHELSLNLELRRSNSDYEKTVSTNRRRNSRVVLLVGGITALIWFVYFIGFWNRRKRAQRFQARIVAVEAEAQRQAKTAAGNKVEPATPLSHQSK